MKILTLDHCVSTRTPSIECKLACTCTYMFVHTYDAACSVCREPRGSYFLMMCSGVNCCKFIIEFSQSADDVPDWCVNLKIFCECISLQVVLDSICAPGKLVTSRVCTCNYMFVYQPCVCVAA